MRVLIVADPVELAHAVADEVAMLIERKPDAVLGAAAGSSPLPVYAELVRRRSAGAISLDAAQVFLLDEYLGLPRGHPQSYLSFVRANFTDPVGIPSESVHGLDGMAQDPEAACVDYERAIREAGGIDLQLLGIGRNGHIAFNEPVSSLASRTRVKILTEETRVDNARFFASVGEVPREVMTQGIGTILEARHLVLVATGDTKSSAVASAVEGPVTAMIPASALQLHPRVTVVVDEAAASQLDRTQYYRSSTAIRSARP